MLSLFLLMFAFVFAVLAAFAPWNRPDRSWWGPPHFGWLAVALYFLDLVLHAGGVR
jgi:hypothetical protein